MALGEWSREAMVTATTEAVSFCLERSIPTHRLARCQVLTLIRTFESGFLTLSIFPFAKPFFPKLFRARERAAAVMLEYMRRGGYKTASGLVRKRFEHHHDQFGFDIDDVACGELGNTFAVLGNSTPCAL